MTNSRRTSRGPAVEKHWSNASPFNYQYLLFFLRLSSSSLRRLPCPPVILFLPSIFPPVPCFRRQFLHRMWPISLVFLRFSVCRMLFPPWLNDFFLFVTICPTDLIRLTPAMHVEEYMAEKQAALFLKYKIITVIVKVLWGFKFYIW
jgi:hypothetical protein